MQKNNYTDIMEKNHMEIPWHDYTENDSNVLINKAGLIEKASVIGRVGLIIMARRRKSLQMDLSISFMRSRTERFRRKTAAWN